MKNISITLCLAIVLLSTQCRVKPAHENAGVAVGADQMSLLLPKLEDKNVALVVNHTSLVGKKHLIDTLISSGVRIRKVFAPEHGFRGAAADGEKISDGVDDKQDCLLFRCMAQTGNPRRNSYRMSTS